MGGSKGDLLCRFLNGFDPDIRPERANITNPSDIGCINWLKLWNPYHLTIDRDNLDEPGSVNTDTGWNWSYIPLPANDTFKWDRPDGSSYLWGAMAHLSISRNDDDIIYVVANLANHAGHPADG